MAEIVKPFAVAEPRLRSVKLGRSSLESPRLGAESAVVTAASNAPVPLQLLLAPHDAGTTSRSVLVRTPFGAAAKGRSKRCVPSSDAFRLAVIVPGNTTVVPLALTAGAVTVLVKDA